MLSYFFFIPFYLFIASPFDTWSAFFVLLVARLVTFSLILRTYVAPWALARVSRHVRVRSISLRSIRGIYFKKGRLTCRIERIAVSFHSSRFEGSSRLSLRVEGLDLHADAEGAVSDPPSPNPQKNGAPLACRETPWSERALWATLYTLEPFIRPAARVMILYLIRTFINWLPFITQMLEVTFVSPSIAYPHFLGSQVTAEELYLHCSLGFSQMDTIPTVGASLAAPNLASTAAGIAAWRQKASGSFARNWNRAWGQVIASGKVEFRATKIIATIIPLDDVGPSTVLSFPKNINSMVALRFSPGLKKIVDHSTEIDFNLGEFHVVAEHLRTALDTWKRRQALKIHTVKTTNESEFLHSIPETSSPVAMESQSPPPVTKTKPPAARRSRMSRLSTRFSRNSQFFESLSASMLPGTRAKSTDIETDRTSKKVRLNFLLSAQISLSKCVITDSLAYSGKEERYEAVFRGISVSGGRRSKEHHDHTRWVGRFKSHSQSNAHEHEFKFAFSSITFDRKQPQDYLRLVNVAGLCLGIYTSHWPSPWLSPPRLPSGDTNSPLAVVNLAIGDIDITERLDALIKYTKTIPSRPAQIPQKQPTRQPQHLPRIIFEAACGPIRASLICPNALPDGEPLAAELHTDGFVFSVSSFFNSLPKSLAQQLENLHHDAITLEYVIAGHISPIFLRTRSRGHGPPQAFSPGDIEDPLLASCDFIEFSGSGAMLGHVDETRGRNVVDPTAGVLHLHTSSDFICVELWHQNSISLVQKIVSSFDHRQVPVHPTEKQALSSRLPRGVNLSVSLGRVVGFVTAPDLNPKETTDMSRGIAARSAISVHYSCLGAVQTFFFERLLGRLEDRLGLSLPEEPSLDALDFAKTRDQLRDPAAFVKVIMQNIVVRSALATQYSPDDPDMAERDSFGLQETEILRVDRIDSNCHLGVLGSSPDESCEVNVQISQCSLTFRMLHVYSATLAVQTLRTILPDKRPPKASRPKSSLPVSIRVRVNAIEAIAHLPHKDLQMELHDIDCRSSLGQVALDWSLLCVNVVVPRVDRWLEDKRDRWEEMGSIQRGYVALHLDNSKPIAVKATSLRIRIPYGYIFSDLVLDLSVIFKACRHLVHLIPAKQLRPMPSPPPEDAKKVPTISFNIDQVSIEAADDDFEARLGLIWQAGLEAAKVKQDREQAFMMKVASIAASGDPAPSAYTNGTGDPDEYEFGPKHTVSVHEARKRLDQVHCMDWKYRLEAFRQKRTESEQNILKGFSKHHGKSYTNFRRRIQIHTPAPVPPLFRALIQHLVVTISPPTFPPSSLPQFLHTNGNGMPTDTLFSLLIPMHLQLRLASLRISLRDYPLPLLNVPPSMTKDSLTWSFSTNLVIAEEMGTDASVNWVPLTIVDEKEPGGQSKLVLDVPKTIMPVKTYADVEVISSTPGITTIAWGVSYQPATQDLLRVLDNLTSPPHDPSPGLGFWDKLRLVFHWKIRVNFANDVRFHMKGSRNPYETGGPGAGLALSWQGSPVLTVGHENDNNELVQVTSQSMFLIIPRLDEKCLFRVLCGPTDGGDGVQKVCAAFSSGVCFGVGFFLERTCGPLSSCHCNGSRFDRACRMFTFAPHYSVILEKKAVPPLLGSLEDSYRNFRSDFVHLSISLSSSLNKHAATQPSSLHFTPNFFTHFWFWWGLFDSALSLPIRMGKYFPPKHISPKFGRHLATIKYRLMVSKLFLFHAYMENNQDTWADGITPFVGIKAFIEEFHADMHQREEETITINPNTKTSQTSRRKPFYAIEVVLQGLDLRALSAVVEEKAKKDVAVSASGQPSNYRARVHGLDAPPVGWLDDNDFIDVNWRPPKTPTITFIPAVTCPRFTYFKQTPVGKESKTKFGLENSHRCLLGKEKSVVQIQLGLIEDRLNQLKSELLKQSPLPGVDGDSPFALIKRSIGVLQSHAERLRRLDGVSSVTMSPNPGSHITTHDTNFEEWIEFDHVYQAHCPQIYLDRAVRDIMIQYYYCSRSRRGLEYHMAARAVKFIRDQADAALLHTSTEDQDKNLATQAAEAFRRIVGVEATKPTREHPEPQQRSADPLDGWSEGVLLEKQHFGLLVKPQIVLKGEETVKALCIIAATEVRLKGYTILDESNKDDPVSGNIMTRTYAKATELQTFAPTNPDHAGNGHLPLEIFVDDKCDCLEFDRLVPQTTATLQYDKFNRLRLRNNVTAVRVSDNKAALSRNDHLYNQTDLVDIHVPQFTIIANDRHFQYISHIVTKLILFSDPAHKTRMNKLETLLFQYDFTDLTNAADVVMRLQSRIRAVKEELAWLEAQRDTEEIFDEAEYHALGASAFVLYDELSTIFDTIKLAQDHADDRSDHQKSALLLHTSSSEISWRMFERDASLAKIAVRNSHFHWLSRQDGSMENTVTIGDLQAFDTSPDAMWAEILAKYDEATGHPMLKSGLFALAEWTVLPPVGGITIYEEFKAEFHPMRIQIDAKLGTRILEYLLPGRKARRLAAKSNPNKEQDAPPLTKITRASIDSPPSPHSPTILDDQNLAPPSLRRLGASRSFTDLRSANVEFRPQLKRAKSIIALASSADEADEMPSEPRPVVRFTNSGRKVVEGAAVMKTRASQKTFVHVQISSLHLLLSIVKERSFECHNARIRTRELEYRNETSSFEEMVNRFIPSNLSWKGWVKMAFNQPLLPVFPVARELLSKTKFIGAHKNIRDGNSPLPGSFLKKNLRRHGRSSSAEQAKANNDSDSSLVHVTSKPLVDEPEEEKDVNSKRPPRPRLISLFNRNPRKSVDTARQDSNRPAGRSLDMPRPTL